MYPFPGTASPEMSARLRNEAETIGEIAIDVYRNTDHYAMHRVSVESADTTGNTRVVISTTKPRQRGHRLFSPYLRSPLESGRWPARATNTVKRIPRCIQRLTDDSLHDPGCTARPHRERHRHDIQVDVTSVADGRVSSVDPLAAVRVDRAVLVLPRVFGTCRGFNTLSECGLLAAIGRRLTRPCRRGRTACR